MWRVSWIWNKYLSRFLNPDFKWCQYDFESTSREEFFCNNSRKSPTIRNLLLLNFRMCCFWRWHTYYFWPPTFAEVNKNVSGLWEKFWQFKIMIQSFLLELVSPGRARQSIETGQKCTLPALLNKTSNETNLCLKYFSWHQPKLTEDSRKVNVCYKESTRRAKSRYVSHT